MKNVKDIANEGKSEAKGAMNDVSNRLSHFKDDAQDYAEKAGSNIRDFYDQKRSELSELLDGTTTHIRQKPLQSGLIALAAGYILGRLLSR